MGDISTVLGYRSLLPSLCTAVTVRDWGHEVGGRCRGEGAEAQKGTERVREGIEDGRQTDGLSHTYMHVDGDAFKISAHKCLGSHNMFSFKLGLFFRLFFSRSLFGK